MSHFKVAPRNTENPIRATKESTIEYITINRAIIIIVLKIRVEAAADKNFFWL